MYNWGHKPFIIIYPFTTSARVKSYQLLKVVSGGRAPGKSSSLASPQLLVIETISLFWGRAPGKSLRFFLYCVDFKNLYVIILSRGQIAGCCLLAARLLLAVACFIPTCHRWVDRSCPRPCCTSYHPSLPMGFATAKPFALQEI